MIINKLNIIKKLNSYKMHSTCIKTYFKSLNRTLFITTNKLFKEYQVFNSKQFNTDFLQLIQSECIYYISIIIMPLLSHIMRKNLIEPKAGSKLEPKVYCEPLIQNSDSKLEQSSQTFNREKILIFNH